MEQRTTAYISLGGNMGNEPEVFADALKRMATWPGIRIEASSACYSTEPQGDPDQPWFTNQVAAVSCETGITPASFLNALLALEKDLGRVRNTTRRNGPRRIDLDLLLFGNAVVSSERLTLPHPRLCSRAFVLVPLLEIAPSDMALPEGETLAACLSRLPYRLEEKNIFQ